MRSIEVSFTSPSEKFLDRARYISLEDLIGKFGIYPGHERFITMLKRSVGYYVDEGGNRWFVAHDYGVFRVEGERASVLTRIFIRGKSVVELRRKLRERLERINRYDKLIRDNLRNLEKFLLKRMAEVERFL